MDFPPGYVEKIFGFKISKWKTADEREIVIDVVYEILDDAHEEIITTQDEIAFTIIFGNNSGSEPEVLARQLGERISAELNDAGCTSFEIEIAK